MKERKYYKSSYEKHFGTELESDLISEVSRDALYNKAYVNFKDAMDLVIANQPQGWDSQDPPVKPTPFPSDIYTFVQDKLEERLGRDDFTLKFFTAAGSAFDKLHGVDAFFTVKIPDKQPVYATIDITQNPDKAARGHKADTIILIPANFLDTDQESAADKQAAQTTREKQEQKWAKEIASIIEDKLAMAA